MTRVHVAGLDPQPAPGSGFRVVESTRSEGAARDIPPDIATCADCVAELFDPADRRYRYPFVNCTNCGPRATVIDDLPYDRRRTAMAGFELCRACAAEYADPADRRFHAEPVACPDCGPRLSWWENGRAAVWHGEDALRSAVDLIRLGGIAALKGLGGYQLVCDATRTGTVARLRRGKHRPTKPFALMVPGLAAASAVAHLTAAETRLLTSPARPIVLVRARRGEPAMAGSVHPGTDRIGLFLPTTGLHHLLLHDLGRPLVVTSGNRVGEPSAIDDAGAQAGLAPIVDGFLRHDRPIRSRYDDSVTRAW